MKARVNFFFRLYGYIFLNKENWAARIQRMIFYLLYYCFARHLPGNSKPYALGARYIRGFLAKRLFKNCGQKPFIERGATFADGSQLEIGDDSSIGINCRIARAKIGNGVMMGADVVFITDNHNFSDPDKPIKYRGIIAAPTITVGDNTWIGTRVIILPGRQIGHNCIIGAGAVVTRDVPDFAIIGGNPAKVIRYRK